MNEMSVSRPFVGRKPYRMDAASYIRLVLAGGFGDAHVELVGGELIEIAPAGMDHGKSNADILVDLSAIYRPLGFTVVNDVIVHLDDETVRTPDISVIDRDIGERKYLEPDDILLAVEISNSTLSEDISNKRADYARSGIRHYWVVDLKGCSTHCFADSRGTDYATAEEVPFGQAVVAPRSDKTIVVR